MGDFRFNCPYCEQSLEVPEEMVGQRVECPTCKGAIGLTAPQAQATPSTPQPVERVVLNNSGTPSPTQRPQFQCPRCGTDECKKVSVVYEAGTFTGTIVGMGTDLDGDVGIGGGITQKRSLLASRLAPPAQPGGGGALLLAMLTACGIIGLIGAIALQAMDVTAGLFWGFVVFVLAVVTIIAMVGHLQEKKEYPALLQAWERRWVCMKCGHTWSNP